MEFKLMPGGAVTGEARVPGDKSISHRSIMLGALADGRTEITGFLEGEDALATVAAFRAMGVEIDGPDQGRVTVHGVGIDGLTAPAEPLDMGNSGTSMRLLSGLLAGQPFDSVLTGDSSLQARPMGRVIDPLTLMGAAISGTDEGRPPLRISGGHALKGIHYDLPMASAQVKSCVLLAGLFAEGRTSVTEPAPTRDHTERMLRGFGYAVERNEGVISLQGGGRLSGCDIEVPADISSSPILLPPFLSLSLLIHLVISPRSPPSIPPLLLSLPVLSFLPPSPSFLPPSFPSSSPLLSPLLYRKFSPLESQSRFFLFPFSLYPPTFPSRSLP